MTMSRTTGIGLAILALTTLLAGADSTGQFLPVIIANTIPRSSSPNGILGDAWTFRCPKGGTFSASVDTFDDDGQENATLAPFLQVDDGEGNPVVFADEDVACTFPPVCGAGCPFVTDVPCGAKDPHLLRIGSSYGGGCGGGGYQLTLAVKDSKGVAVEPKKIRLGGGAARKLPKLFDLDGARREGPALNDEYIDVF